MGREVAFIGFGSNVGDRFDFCDRAVTLLELLPGSRLTAVSSLYETEPVVDVTDPGTGWFLNGVVRLETEIPAHRLHEVCCEIERALGRPDDRRGGPRTMDLDVLFYGARVIEEAGLIIPHPRLHHRRFVLAPLVELDADWPHPVLKQSMRTLLETLTDLHAVRLAPLPPGSRYRHRPSCPPWGAAPSADRSA